jgi:hypothetical protein
MKNERFWRLGLGGACIGLVLGVIPASAGMSTFADYPTWAAGVTGLTTVTVPDPQPNSYIYFGSGTESVTYSGVTFSQSSTLGNGNFFNVGFLFSDNPAVISSQEQSSGVANILITLPSPVTAIALDAGYGTFEGSPVTFTLSNGDSVTQASTGSGYGTPDLFAAIDTTPFTSLLLTSPDFVLDVSNVEFGDGAVTPEPSFYGVLGMGMAGLLFTARRRLARNS